MPHDRPLAFLLSQALVAFTIELDNEFEHRMPHRTAAGPGPLGTGPWLVSQALWTNFLRLVDPGGTPLRDLSVAARRVNLAGLERWGYVTVGPDPGDARTTPPRREWIVRLTPGGRQAQETWRPLAGEIEGRWRARFGRNRVDELRAALADVAGRLEPGLPAGLPVLGLGFRAPVLFDDPAGHLPTDAATGDELSTLLARVLLALTIDYERDTKVSLAMGADVLWLIDDAGVRVGDLPRRAGLSKEAIRIAVGYLASHGLVTADPGPASSARAVLHPTDAGHRAQASGRRRLAGVEAAWQGRFGVASMDRLRRALEPLAGEPGGASPLLEGLVPYPDGWRASVPRPETLPRYPLVLHRGGYPDGS